ncbi:MAG: DUF6869 domain-containing protein [Methylovirgula sp.]
MDGNQIRELAGRWITFQKTTDPRFGDRKSKANEDNPEHRVALSLIDQTLRDWPSALAVCIEVAVESDDPWILEILGAGPLEDLLENHGDTVLNHFLAAAKDNPNFRQALYHIWSCTDKDVWLRFLQIRDELKIILEM